MTIPFTQCSEKLGYLILQLAKNFIVYMAMVVACNGLHFILKPYSQPRITSDIVVGIVLGNIPFLRKLFDEFNRAFGFIMDFGMMCYMFALGIEMDPNVLFKRPNKDALVAYTAILCTFVISMAMVPFLHFFSRHTGVAFTISVSALLASSASPVLTRLLTNMKIGKSDIGKLVIAAGMHSDLVCLLIFSICYIFMPTDAYCIGHHSERTLKNAIKTIIAVVVQTTFTAMVSPVFMAWVNNENPEGRPMKGSHLVLSVAFMVLICSPSTLYDFSPVLSAFMTGICLPRDGRVSKWIISKINYILSTIFFPMFFLWMGNAANVTQFRPGDPTTWLRFFIPILIVVTGKIVGTLISGAILGFNWRESILIGLLLVTKGHFQIYMAIKVLTCRIKDGADSTGLLSVASIFFAVVHAPAVVTQIIKRARKRAPTHSNALQLLKPSSELRIFLCLHGLDNVPSSINFMEISRGISDPGMVIYVAEIIELTEHISSVMQNGEGVQSNTIKDKAVVEMREQITNLFQAYIDNDGDGITLKRALALSTINNMAQNICVLAEDLMIALIILPFHRNQRQDGKLDGGNPGFRHVNRKLLKNSPCSVGILVNRGFGSIGKISRSQQSVKVAAIFIGGRDDREALCYVGRVAWHQGVHVTVIRFLVDTSAESTRLAAYRVSLPEEEEMGLDDECFAQFYEQHIVGGRIAYLEKHLSNASETFSTLKSFEGEYSLVIVGRKAGANSVLTKGMNDWQQCPELGPIGDVLSGPDFSKSVSVLIIQQHKLRGELDGLDEDFTIM